MKLVDMVGQRFGGLVVLEKSKKRKHNKVWWICLCDCGGYTEVVGAELRRGRNKFCRRGGHSKIGEGVAAFNTFYRNTKHHAAQRGYEWDLSKEQVKEISSKNCHYCGTPPQQVIKAEKGRCVGEYVYNGIDRIDNSKGYFIENCVPCCGTCNHAKDVMRVEAFKRWIKSVHGHWASR